MPKFSGEPQATWLTEQGPDRKMKLLQDFWFKDRAGKTWPADEGEEVDGASIPRFLWSLVGSPYTGDYRRASIVHDVACVAAEGNPAARKEADRMFYEACREGGCSWWDSVVLYIGVRFGAWIGGNALIEDDGRPRLSENSSEEALKLEFKSVSDEVLRQGEDDRAEIVEARTDKAMDRAAERLALTSRILGLAIPPVSHPPA